MDVSDTLSLGEELKINQVSKWAMNLLGQMDVSFETGNRKKILFCKKTPGVAFAQDIETSKCKVISSVGSI